MTAPVVADAEHLLAVAIAAGAERAEFELTVDRPGSMSTSAVRALVEWRRPNVVEEAPVAAPQPVERLPWDSYAYELREALKELARRYPPDTVADAAIRLAELVAEHGKAGLRAARPEAAR